MNLSLRYEPVPKNAPRFAADIVEAARNISGVELDYSLESLASVDGIIEGIRRDGPPVEAVAETLFGFGCYVGEVLVRAGEGRWDAPTREESEVMAFPFMVRFPSGSWANPLGRVFRRYEKGAEYDLSYFAQPYLGDRG